MKDSKEVMPENLEFLARIVANGLHEAEIVNGEEWNRLFRSERFGRAVAEVTRNFLHPPAQIVAAQRTDPDDRNTFPGNVIPDPLRP